MRPIPPPIYCHGRPEPGGSDERAAHLDCERIAIGILLRRVCQRLPVLGRPVVRPKPSWLAPFGHCEARSWPKQSPAMIEREIASHERLAMTDNWGSPSPVPALAPLSLRVLHSAGALTLREDTRRIASHKYYVFASCRRFLRSRSCEAISLSDISGDCFARAARNDRKEKRFAGCQWHAARNQDHAALPKNSRVLPHHSCAALYTYTHYSFIRSLSFVDGPLPTNFSYTLTK